MEYSCPSEGRITNGTNGTRSRRLQTSAIIAALYQKLPALHHLLAVEPDVEIAAYAVDVRLGNPVCAGVLGVGMTKRDVDSRNFFVLRASTYEVRQGRVTAAEYSTG